MIKWGLPKIHHAATSPTLKGMSDHQTEKGQIFQTLVYYRTWQTSGPDQKYFTDKVRTLGKYMIKLGLPKIHHAATSPTLKGKADRQMEKKTKTTRL